MQEISNLIQATIKSLYNLDSEVILSRPENEFGDIYSNIALKISKEVGKSPRVIADEIIDKINKSNDGNIAKIETAGPGFINIWLEDKVLISNLDNLTNELEIHSGKNFLVEYSDPNPFKPLHAGHLYTTLVGDSISRLIERGGAKVIRLSYGGDVGLHVGKSMWSIVKNLEGEHPEKLNDISESERAKWLGERYVEGNTAYDDDPKSKDEIVATNKKVYAIHKSNDKESAFAKIYWTCREWSYEYFKDLYKELQIIEFDRFIPESEVVDLGVSKVEEQLKKGVYQESDGAVVYKGEDKGLHTRVFINSEGLPTYEAKDIGLLQLKWNDYKYEQSIIITANEQSQYMQVVLASLAEYEPEISQKTKHITHGVVKLVGGVKMSSRKGNTVSAMDIIESAYQAAVKQDKGADHTIVLSAIKYAFAKTRIGGDIIYDPIESIALEGNSGPYIQYAHARAASILSKVEQKKSDFVSEKLEKSERALVAKLNQYSDVLVQSINELSPHLVTTYLHELAQEFNRFYENSRVIDDPRQDFRIFLITKYADVLKDGLSLLGISAPDKM